MVLEQVGPIMAWTPSLTLAAGAEIVFGVMGSVGIIAILAGTISSVINTRARERTKREIAAYVAEGSITPEQGEKMILAAKSKD